MASNQNRFEALSPANNDDGKRRNSKKKNNKQVEDGSEPLLARKSPTKVTHIILTLLLSLVKNQLISMRRERMTIF